MKNRLKELRTQNNITQMQLAKYLKVSQGTLSYWENGTYDIDTDNLIKISDYFDVSIDYLLGRIRKTTAVLKDSELNTKEKRLITEYRNKPEMQSAIDKLLGLDDKVIQMDQPEKTYKIRSVARGGHITEFELDEQGLKDLEEAIKKTDASDL